MNLYDFDKTIYFPDSMHQFAKYCIKRYPLLNFTYKRRLKKIYRMNKKGRCSHLDFEEVLNGLIGYLKNPEKDIQNFWNIHKKDILPWYLKQKREDDVIISASPDYLIEPICNYLGVKCYASKVDRKTGKGIEKPYYGEEKIKLLKKIGFNNFENFYSDSLSDTPVAKLIKNSYLVKNKGNEIVEWPIITPELAKEIKEKFEITV